MGFPRQEYWSGLPFPSPGDPPDPGTEPTSPALQVDSLPLSHRRNPCTDPSKLKGIYLSPTPFLIAKENKEYLLRIPGPGS